ncbi:MAG TPA: TadE/TadG family type IV pilus assembly protein [Xanthobacteraceae bacterium]|nr:TadE/TadG family type IV pilus assembly protein [Xanthobacteraceae bacterium]
MHPGQPNARAGSTPWLRPLRRLWRRDDGAAAVEFGLVAVPFLALLFAIMETALVFFAGQALETAAADSARLILTGQAQMQGLDQTNFKSAVCSKVYGLFDCNNGVKVDVRKYTSFSNITVPNPIDENGNLTEDFVYQPGGPGDIVVVRLMYKWPIVTSLLGLNNLSNMAGSNRLLVATVAFRNEPYQ